jgi:kynurenine 3-monooxygenase
MQNRKITILGAGLVGSLLGILLKKKGYEVEIFERRPDMRTAAVQAGRSINLAMSTRGWKAIELAGLKEEIEKIAIPMYGRQIHNLDGSSPYQAYGKNNEAIYSVSRGELNKKLMDLAEANGVRIHFEHRSNKVDVATNVCEFQLADGSFITHQADLLFGADGAYSSLRTSYSFTDRTDYTQAYIEHGYKELNIPAGAGNSFLIEKNALHIWPRKNFMLIALPNMDGSFTCTLFFPFEGHPSFESIKTEEEIRQFFGEAFPDAVAIMPTLVEDFLHNPTSSLITTRIYPWVHQDKSALIGDAAHAIVPFYGQGMNAGFEDCSVLMELMNEHADEDWAFVLQRYQEARKPNGDAVLQLALQNFIEMRDLVADPKFLERKKIEKELGKLYPGTFNSIYEMVSFSHTPYQFAMHCIKAQDELLGQIMAEGSFEDNLQQPTFKTRLDSWMESYRLKVSN